MTFSRLCAVLCAAMVVASCAQPVRLGVAPNIYSNIDFYPETEVPAYLRTVRPELFYVTDRARMPGADGVTYSHERSDAMVFGRSTVVFGNDLTWPELVFFSVRADSRRKIGLRVAQNEELVQFSPTPLPFGDASGQERIAPEALAENDARTAEMQAIIAAELRRANRREVIIYVHGYANDFDDGQATLANIWHFSGRVGVPIMYSWPADNPGLFGYFKDRESGEFSIFHLKQFLRMLAAIPELEQIHIVAHSQGADVTSTALREIVIGERAAGRDPRQSLKIANLILAAPDIDFGVVRQRLIAERFGPAFGQITVYLNKHDSALGLAQTLMSGVRMGRMSLDDLSDEVREIFSRMGNVNFVDVERPGNSISHSYFRDNPAVVSDIVLTIRTSAMPGGPDRPLESLGGNFWALHQNYPDPRRMVELWDLQKRNDER